MRLDITRRGALVQALAPLLLTTAIPPDALAFDNRLPPNELELKYKQPRTPGPKPTDLGPRDGFKLKSCTDGKPHCFSSTPESFEDDDLFGSDSGASAEGWLVEPFAFDKPLAEAAAEVKAAIAAYPPGQR